MTWEHRAIVYCMRLDWHIQVYVVSPMSLHKENV